MPGQMTDIQTITATPGELDAAGQPIPLTPAQASQIKWTVNDPTIAELTEVGDGTASFKGLKPGTTQVGVVDNSTGLSASDSLTVTVSAAASIGIAFGTPSDHATSSDNPTPIVTTPAPPPTDVPVTPIVTVPPVDTTVTTPEPDVDPVTGLPVTQ